QYRRPATHANASSKNSNPGPVHPSRVLACRGSGAAGVPQARQSRWVHGESVEEGQALLKQGFRCLEYWGDSFIYRQALSQAISSLRESIRVAPERALSSD